MKNITRKVKIAAPKIEGAAGHVWTVGEQQMLKFINDFLKGALANSQRVLRKEDLVLSEASKAFAVQILKRELEARDISFDDAIKDPNQVCNVVIQLFEYKNAILRRNIYFIKKECPDVFHQDAEVAEAANAGILARHLNIDDPDLIAWTKKENVSRAAQRAFDLAISRKNPARWKYPELDLWLILVWPLVTAEKWSYPTVHYLADQKFPELKAKPMASAEALGFHCKKTLGLKISEPKGGRPKNDMFDLKNPSPIQDFAINIDADLPEYFDLKTRK
jgi:hypothetical protein